MEPDFEAFAEAVLVVADAAPFLRVFQEVGGYTLLHEGRPDAAWAEAGYRGAGQGREWLLGLPGCAHGRLRLLALPPAPGEALPGLLREDDQPWDRGGIFDLNVRVRDAQAIAAAFRAHGWRGEAPPVRWRLGELEVVEWLANGPEGVRIAFIQRLAPPLSDAAARPAFGEIFNSSQIVGDEAAALRFYRDGLGCRLRMVHETEHFFDGDNVFGLPPQMARGQRLRIALLDLPGGAGMLELIAFPGLAGRDLAAVTQPPRRGVAALRFAVSGLEARAAQLARVAPQCLGPRFEAELAPYGRVEALVLNSPEGARIELFAARCGR